MPRTHKKSGKNNMVNKKPSKLHPRLIGGKVHKGGTGTTGTVSPKKSSNLSAHPAAKGSSRAATMYNKAMKGLI